MEVKADGAVTAELKRFSRKDGPGCQRGGQWAGHVGHCSVPTWVPVWEAAGSYPCSSQHPFELENALFAVIVERQNDFCNKCLFFTWSLFES